MFRVLRTRGVVFVWQICHHGVFPPSCIPWKALKPGVPGEVTLWAPHWLHRRQCYSCTAMGHSLISATDSGGETLQRKKKQYSLGMSGLDLADSLIKFHFPAGPYVTSSALFPIKLCTSWKLVNVPLSPFCYGTMNKKDYCTGGQPVQYRRSQIKAPRHVQRATQWNLCLTYRKR